MAMQDYRFAGRLGVGIVTFLFGLFALMLIIFLLGEKPSPSISPLQSVDSSPPLAPSTWEQPPTVPNLLSLEPETVSDNIAQAPSFTDIASSSHRDNINTLAANNITRGCNPPENSRFCPDREVTRGEMASILVRALELETTGEWSIGSDARSGEANTLIDISGNTHRNNILAIADNGISRGCNPPTNDRFCPDRAMSRAEMATVLVRWLELDRTSMGSGGVTDIADSVHQNNILVFIDHGISRGCNPPSNTRFCPDRSLTRGEMATILVRALGLDTTSNTPANSRTTLVVGGPGGFVPSGSIGSPSSGGAATPPSSSSSSSVVSIPTTTTIPPEFIEATRTWQTDWTKKSVDLSEVVIGVEDLSQPAALTPPIDSPTFASIAQSQWLDEEEIGITITGGNEARFYPLTILHRHGVVNDEIDGDSIAVTYCPICTAAEVYSREVSGQTLSFEIAGLIHQNEQLLRDTQTHSLWQQTLGEAIAGAHNGEELTPVDSQTISFSQFTNDHPSGMVLSSQQGSEIVYGTYPYQQQTQVKPSRYSDRMDDRLDPLEPVIGVRIGEDVTDSVSGDTVLASRRAYSHGELATQKVINDRLGGESLAIFWAQQPSSSQDQGTNRLFSYLGLKPPSSLGQTTTNSSPLGTGIAYRAEQGGRELTFVVHADGFQDEQTESIWNWQGLSTSGTLQGTQLEVIPHSNEYWFTWSVFFSETPKLWAPTNETISASRITTTAVSLSPYLSAGSSGWNTNWNRRTIDLSDLRYGLSGSDTRDGIPPIDNPEFLEVTEITDGTVSLPNWMDDNTPGIQFVHEGDARFYPIPILHRHEIVNDNFGDTPVVVTYCPLCNTAVVFSRVVNGETLRFGVSGLLRNSDLVMWEGTPPNYRSDGSHSLWQQATGEGIVGDFAGVLLNRLPSSIVNWGSFSTSYPTGRLLSRDRTYGTNPYVSYSSGTTPYSWTYPDDLVWDERIPLLERVVGVRVGEVAKAYAFSRITTARVVNDVIDETPVVVFWGEPDTVDPLDQTVIADSRGIGIGVAYLSTLNGQVYNFSANDDGTFTDAETSSIWNILGRAIVGPLSEGDEPAQLETALHGNEFWFAWQLFYPDADFWEPPGSSPTSSSSSSSSSSTTSSSMTIPPTVPPATPPVTPPATPPPATGTTMPSTLPPSSATAPTNQPTVPTETQPSAPDITMTPTSATSPPATPPVTPPATPPPATGTTMSSTSPSSDTTSPTTQPTVPDTTAPPSSPTSATTSPGSPPTVTPPTQPTTQPTTLPTDPTVPPDTPATVPDSIPDSVPDSVPDNDPPISPPSATSTSSSSTTSSSTTSSSTTSTAPITPTTEPMSSQTTPTTLTPVTSPPMTQPPTTQPPPATTTSTFPLAPDFSVTLDEEQGATYALHASGRPVILHFWEQW